MDNLHYREMISNLERLNSEGKLDECYIYLFGHCNATEVLTDWLLEHGFHVIAILDNNKNKQGGAYKNIPIVPPQVVLKHNIESTLICIVSRACAVMEKQLYDMLYKGKIERLVDYNSFSEYCLSRKTIEKKIERLNCGIKVLEGIRKQYEGQFYIICPYPALGDVYYTMAYLPKFLKERGIEDYSIIVASDSCAAVAKMFAALRVEVLCQKDMDVLVQAALYTREKKIFIAHHDRLYTNLTIKALDLKLVSFEDLYRYGIFGLEKDVIREKPIVLKRYDNLEKIRKGKAVILSPNAKSVIEIPVAVWNKVIDYYKIREYQIYTNIVGEEKPLPGTLPLIATLSEMQSIIEWAGTFIGIRSGLCDVITTAVCRKIVLFPNSYYSNTRWKIADFFWLQGWENIIVENYNEE